MVQIGKSHKERVRNGYRSVLSDAGRRSLAWTDRRNIAELAKHWRITPDSEGHPQPKVKDYRLDGTKLKMLARELKHTDGVSEFTAMMMTEAREHSRYEVVSVLPPHRWTELFASTANGRPSNPMRHTS